ncbi:flagellar basal-body rod protein FlgF [Plasticicumulans acidivorans]|uniref:Flagellar basal-body rod protein FlgF n=1 Tax=Plasticicumulans acidivorans TaxID=886464 RepID=A0A317MWS5_9GAMM|nr:flagellar basal-body rod protein FlgF [Plasticicumulans acidivorans]PWV63319.1 flagellar basal-body rod protein FlgF [Plasticicumulans acidivorans]
MDRMLYVAMSGARQILDAQRVNTNNLANASTTGFRQDIAAMRSQPVIGDGLPSRVYAQTERAGVDLSAGPLLETGRDLDVAVRGEGFIAVRDLDGHEAYTRAGDLQVDASGRLTTAKGYAVLGDNGPIALPPSEKTDIAADGTISVKPLGEDNTAIAAVDRIRLVQPAAQDLIKGADGLLRRKDGGTSPADARVHLVSGALEGSNVNTADALVTMIDLARRYETQVKLMSTAADNERATDKLLGLG